MELTVPYSSPHMSSSGASPLAAWLSMACANSDLPSAKAAVAAGASVNENGWVPWGGMVLPLRAAVLRQHYDLVVLLLSHGADPNGDQVMHHGAYYSTAAILQLLIDAGGDVNRNSGETPPLFSAIVGRTRQAEVRVLLAQPSLDLTIKHNRKTPEQYARDRDEPALAVMIAQEVSGRFRDNFRFLRVIRFLAHSTRLA